VRRVELFACPDALGKAGTAEPHVFVDGGDAVGGAGAADGARALSGRDADAVAAVPVLRCARGGAQRRACWALDAVSA
jgi:hypothetical protein